MDYSEHQDNLIDHDEESAVTDAIYDELYLEECERIEKKIQAAKKGTFEAFRDRFINRVNEVVTKIN